MIHIPKTRTKYGSKKTKVDGITFDSHLEALRYIELKRLKQAGIVKEIEPQPAFELQGHYRKCPACGKVWKPLNLEKPFPAKCLWCNTKTPISRAIIYQADFRVTYADGHEEIEDTKGMETRLFQLKRKLFEYHYPDLTLKLVKGVHR